MDFYSLKKNTEINETEKIDYDAGRTGDSGCGNGTRERTGGHHRSYTDGDKLLRSGRVTRESRVSDCVTMI